MSVTKRTSGDYTLQPQANVALGTRANVNVNAHTLVIDGNLKILGDWLAEVEANLVVKDSVLNIAGGSSGINNIHDKGIQFDWWDGSGTAFQGFFGFQDATTYFTFIPNSTHADGNTYIGQVGTISANIAGNVFLANGSAASPSLSFISSNRTGIFYTGSNTFGVSANGIDTARVSQNLLEVYGAANVSGNIRGSYIKANTGFTYGLDSRTTGLTFIDGLTPIIKSDSANVVAFLGQTSAVNYLSVNNSVTGSGLGISASGSDSNIDLIISAKGTGNVIIKPALTASALYIGSLAISGLTPNSIPVVGSGGAISSTSKLIYSEPVGIGFMSLTGNIAASGYITAGSGMLINGNLVLSNVSQFSNAASSDATITGNSTALIATLNTINATVGTFGNTTHYPTFTVNGKGLLTMAGMLPAGPTLLGNTGVGNISPAVNVGIYGTNGVSTSVVNSNVYIQNTGVTGLLYSSGVTGNASTGVISITSNATLQQVTNNGATTSNVVSFLGNSGNYGVFVSSGIAAEIIRSNTGRFLTNVGSFSFGNVQLKSVGDPIDGTDAVNKNFLSTFMNGNISTIIQGDSNVRVVDSGIGGIVEVTLDGALHSYYNATGFMSIVGLGTSNIGMYNSTISTQTGPTSALYSNIDLTLQPKGTGNVIISGPASITSTLSLGGSISQVSTTRANIGNLWIHDNQISSITGNIELVPYAGQMVNITGTAALQIPVGTSAQRPYSQEKAGHIRFNSDLGFLEYYDGSMWVNAFNGITTETIYPDGIANSFVLSSAVTTEGALVSINGTTQRPGNAYTISGTTITFAQTPTITDIIEVRKLTATYNPAVTGDIVSDSGNVVIALIPTIIDTFPATSYRSAKYVVSVSNPTFTNYQTSEVTLVHNGAATVGSVYGTVYTGNLLVNFTSNISGGNVNLMANGTVTGNTIKLQKTYIAV